jgi:hypothetical protein
MNTALGFYNVVFCSQGILTLRMAIWEVLLTPQLHFKAGFAESKLKLSFIHSPL